MGWFPELTTNLLWPIVLILIGVLMLVKHVSKEKRKK